MEQSLTRQAPHRFEADPTAARAEHIASALGVAFVVPAVLWFVGATRHHALLVAAAAVAAVAAYALVAWRTGRHGLLWLEVSEDGLEIARRDGRRTLAWSEITRASRASYGAAWVLATTGQPRHVVIRLDALSRADAARFSALLRAHLKGRPR